MSRMWQWSLPPLLQIWLKSSEQIVEGLMPWRHKTAWIFQKARDHNLAWRNHWRMCQKDNPQIGRLINLTAIISKTGQTYTNSISLQAVALSALKRLLEKTVAMSHRTQRPGFLHSQPKRCLMSLVIQTTQLFQLIWALWGSCQVSIITIHGTFAWRRPTRMERMAIQQPRHQPLDFHNLRGMVLRWTFWFGTRASRAMKATFNRNLVWSFNECVAVFYFQHVIKCPCLFRKFLISNDWIGHDRTFSRCERFGRVSGDPSGFTVGTNTWTMETIQLMTHI